MKRNKSWLPLRLNLLIFIAFALFSLLILRLGVIQIVYGEKYRHELEKTEDFTIAKPVPRGIMYDRNKKIVVENIPRNAITFTNQGTSHSQMLQIAKRLAQLIKVPSDRVTERDEKEYWLMNHSADAFIFPFERKLINQKKLSENELYNLRLNHISNKVLKKLTKKDIDIIAIYRELLKSGKYTTQIIKNNGVTQKEDAVVSENLQYLPGIDTITDWDRSYKFGNTLRSVLGTVTNSDEGLPAEQIDYLLSRGYSRNDRVGKSYLEMQYDEILNGHKSHVKNITDGEGNTLESHIINNGQPGKNLVLCIDMELQKSVEKIIEEELKTVKKLPETDLLDRAYVVLMEPHTGEVLTMAGKRMIYNHELGRREMKDDALGTFTTTYNVGSTVKGATILTGFKTGAIKPNTYFDDKGLKIKGTPLKKSYMYLGTLNDINALKKSSNVYMFHTAIQMGKGHYEYDKPMSLRDPFIFEKIRNSFASFGLGIRTGIDLPNEQVGFKGTSKLPGFLLDLVIGQYDTYSAMQLAQYASTIANGGLRMQPHLVKEIREPQTSNEVGTIVKEIHPKVLNTIDMKKEWLRRVHSGFEKVMTEPGGTAYKFFGSAKYYPAGKTGTAQAFYDGPERNKFGKEPPPVINLSLIAYAPSHNPEIAMAVLVPWAYHDKEDNKISLKIGRRVMDAYFALKRK